jgi:hypothetical protein
MGDGHHDANTVAPLRADPSYEGALMQPVRYETAASGGWRKRNSVPSATMIAYIGLICTGVPSFCDGVFS